MLDICAETGKDLDILFCTGTYKSFKVDFSDVRRKFFTAVNTILSKCTYTSDLVKLSLMESHCLPILLYAVESLNIKHSQLAELNSWWNSVYRKIFNYHKWESVKTLICYLGRLDLVHIVNQRRLLFIKKMSMNHRGNIFICDLLRYYKVSGEYASIFACYHCQEHWTVTKIKGVISNSFNSIALSLSD